MSVTEVKTYVRPEVRRGAEWRDEVRPGWDREINLAELNLQSCAKCVVGQLWPEVHDYSGVEPPLGVPAPARYYDEEYGFDIVGVKPITYRDEYAKLSEEWRDLIAERRTS